MTFVTHKGTLNSNLLIQGFPHLTNKQTCGLESSNTLWHRADVCMSMLVYFLTHTQQAMQSSAVLPVKNTRQTIDSRDLLASRMCSMLGIYNAC